MRIRKNAKRKLVVALVFVIGFGCHAAYNLAREAVQTSELGFPLLMTIQNGDITGVKELLREGANPNFNFSGMTPLKKARMDEHYEIVKLLQAAGAKD